ncbi:MAG: hypothetical protein M3N54_01030 [Acidobacteriota bacterium]|nr:hypothetical protein [Acidobacteriota bacterium]
MPVSAPAGWGHRIIQTKWIAAGKGLQQWDEAMNGLTWFYRDDGNMAFKWSPSASLNLQQFADKWHPHTEWLKAGWGWTPPGEVKAQASLKIGDAIDKGKERHNRMMESKGTIHPQVSAAREWYFDKYYKTDTPEHNDEVSSTYQYYRAADFVPLRGKGEYKNEVAGGVFTAGHNYAVEGQGAEEYYNPVTGKAERMPSNEILYQQWKKRTHGRPLEQITNLRRAHVAGDGLKLLDDILDAFAPSRVEKPNNKWVDGRLVRGTVSAPQLPCTFEEGTKPYFALLAIPNVTAAVFMVAERKKEMGLDGIAAITVEAGKSINIHFKLRGTQARPSACARSFCAF